MGYYPFGETRYTTGSLPTDKLFTGQQKNSYINLLNYRSRWYDGQLGRFISPDSIIPDGNPQSLNRYAYVNNDPINYNDPTGHCMGPGNVWIPDATYYCTPPIEYKLASWGVTVGSGYSPAEKQAILSAVTTIGDSLLNAYQSACTLDYCSANYSSQSIFSAILGGIEFQRDDAKYGSGVCGGGAGGVYCNSEAVLSETFVLHELGHTFDARMGSAGYKATMNASIFTYTGDWVTGSHLVDGKLIWERGLNGYPGAPNYRAPNLYHGPAWSDWNQLYDPVTGEFTGTAYSEEWADMFLNWSAGTFVGAAGKARAIWMNSVVGSLLISDLTP